MKTFLALLVAILVAILSPAGAGQWIYYNETKVHRFVDRNGELHAFLTYRTRYNQETKELNWQLPNGQWVERVSQR